MKKQLAYIFLALVLVACGGNRKKSNAPDFDKLVHRWIDAHNQKDARIFESLYAQKVNYYGEVTDKSNVVEDKFGIFEEAPDFHEELKGRISIDSIPPKIYQCTFYVRVSARQSTFVKKKVLTFEKIGTGWLIVEEDGEKTRLPAQAAIPETATENMQFRYEPDFSAVRGKIAFETFYGAPGYGETPETDAKEVCPVLIPENPINVLADQKDNYTSNVYGVTRIQLISTNDVNLKLYRKKNVRVTGQLFAPETGHHHTDVLMNVEMVEEL